MKESSSFSWNKVLKTCDNDEKLAKTMIERFEKLYFDDAVKQLHESITKEDDNEISTQLHSLWTNFLYIGAVNGETIVKEMESIIPQKNKEALASAYLELLDETKEIKNQVSKTTNSSNKLNEIEQYEKDIIKRYPKAKLTTLRSKVPSVSELNKQNKSVHTKLVQEKIRVKELQLDPTRTQSAYTEVKSPGFPVPKSRILDFNAEPNSEAIVGPSIITETVNKQPKNVAAGAGSHQAYDAKQNSKIEHIHLETKPENITRNTFDSSKGDLRLVTQRLVQAVLALSYDKIQLELKQFQDTLKDLSVVELEAAIARLRTSTQKQIKNQMVDHASALIAETKKLRPRLETKVELPTVEELDKYEKDIRQKFSQNNEYGVEVALEGKKDGAKTTTCCAMF